MPSLVYSDPSDTRGRSKKAPFLPRKLEACNDVELNPGPKSPTKKQSKTANNNNNNQNNMNDVDSREMMPAHDLPRVKKLEQDFNSISTMITNLDTSMQALMECIEDMKPAYVHAMKLMNTANQPTADQKNNLVFYGLEPEPLEIQMEKEPEFCRDILETRIKMIFRETLKISRDIPFVTVYRFTTANADPDEVRPIVATFRSVRDKENILRHTTSSRILRGKGISVTEDFSNKRQAGKDGKVELKKTIKQSEKLKIAEEKVRGSLGKGAVNNGNSADASDTQGSDPRQNMESSAGMSDQMSSCNSDYAPSSNSGSSGNYTDD